MTGFTHEQITRLYAAKNSKEVSEIANQLLAGSGDRAPNWAEVVEGYTEVFYAAGLDDEEVDIITAAAANIARKVMKENDKREPAGQVAGEPKARADNPSIDAAFGSYRL